MGKVLIIKDADFSENGIQLGTSIDIASTITLTRGYNVNGQAGSSVANARTGVVTPIDLSSYIAQGYSVLTAKISAPLLHQQCLQIQDSSGTRIVRPESSYTTNEITINLDASLPYFRYSTARISGTYASETYSASALAEIKLIKY